MIIISSRCFIDKVITKRVKMYIWNCKVIISYEQGCQCHSDFTDWKQVCVRSCTINAHMFISLASGVSEIFVF